MARTVDRSTETKGGEMRVSEFSSRYDFVLAIVQLWNWVGEQRNNLEKAERQMVHRETISTIKGSYSAYSNVRLYMRKFFAGLIDFGETGEKRNGRL
jgi:hypothetical protein